MRFQLVKVGVCLALATAIAAQEPSVVRVTAARATLRAEPSETAPAVDEVMAGAVFELARVEGDWFRVILPPDPRLKGARVHAYLSRKAASQVAGTDAASALTLSRAPRRSPLATSVKVGVDAGGPTTWLSARAVNASLVPGRPESVPAAASIAVFDGPPGATTPEPPGSEVIGTWVWAISPGAPSVTITAGQPSFFVAYTELPDLNSADFVPSLIKIVPGKSGWRLLSIAAGRAGARSNDEADWVVLRQLKQEVVPTSLDGSGPGLVQVRPRVALSPGEYAIVLRPAYARGYSGREILNDAGAGSVFSVAWTFTIKPARF
ncbi:MAG: hypothetical protein ACM4AI_13970 [Acidobacteriota bacterium]